MITSLELENWKSYAQAKLQIDPITVIIGTNASGKSNALDALAFLNRIASGVMPSYALQGDSALPALRGGLEWAALRPGNSFALSVVCRADDLTEYHYRLGFRITDARCDVFTEELKRKKFRVAKDGRQVETSSINLLRSDPCDDAAPTIVVRLYNGKNGTKRELARSQPTLFQLYGQKLTQDQAEGVDEVVSSLRDIFVLDPIPSHMRIYSPLADKLDTDASNIAGVIAALPPHQQAEIELTLTKFAGKLPERDIRRVFAEKIGKFQSDAMLYCDEVWTNVSEAPSTIDARGMSDGTLRFLAILTALLTRPKGSLLVIEEVDNGLHPSRASMLLDMLREVGKERGIDVLATTHNPALLDAMGPKMLPFITVAHRDPATGQSLLTLLEDVKELPKLLAQGSIGRLSSRGAIERALQAQRSFDFDAPVSQHD